MADLSGPAFSGSTSSTESSDFGRLGIRLYTTCPASAYVPVDEYSRRVLDVARWTEECGLDGLLVYTENALADPWLVAQHILAATRRTHPLIAVQPTYMHPFTAARMVGTLAHLHRRAVHINLVVGGFTPDLKALGDGLGHADRYRRLREYHDVFWRLLTGREPVTHTGTHYRIADTRLKPYLDPDLLPAMYVSGASDDCAELAAELDLVRLAYPNEPGAYGDPGLRPLAGCGVRLGVIARDGSDEAWRVAEARFPHDRLGARIHDIAARFADSEWFSQISRRTTAGEALDAAQRPPYWLHPFRIYKTFCPYLVGDYSEVGATLARYLELGVRTFIIDVPREPDDLRHAQTALRHAVASLTRA